MFDMKQVATIPKPDLEDESRPPSPSIERMKLQIELEKIQEATRQQIEDLNDELATV